MKLLQTAVVFAFGFSSVAALADLRVRERVRDCNGDSSCIERVLTEALDKLDDMVERGIRSRIATLETRVSELEKGDGGGGGHHGRWGRRGGNDSVVETVKK